MQAVKEFLGITTATQHADHITNDIIMLNTIPSTEKIARLERFFQKNPITVDQKNKDGRTALHAAASVGDVEIIRYLIEKGADLAIPTPKGHLALNIAIERNHWQAATLLSNTAKIKIPISIHENSIDYLLSHVLSQQATIDQLAASRANSGSSFTRTIVYTAVVACIVYYLTKRSLKKDEGQQKPTQQKNASGNAAVPQLTA